MQGSISGKSIVEKDQIQNHFKENSVDMEVKNVYVTVNQEITGSDCFTAINRKYIPFPVFCCKTITTCNLLVNER